MRHQHIEALLQRFIDGPDRSIAFANEIEGALLTSIGDDERFDDLVSALAQYRPGGGEFLYDEDDMVRLCRAKLSELQTL